jgi:predicted nucleic acid-binding protein
MGQEITWVKRMARAFFDTNILVYLIAGEAQKTERAEELLAEGGVVSVQVLDEFVAVATRKFGAPWNQIRQTLTVLRSILEVCPLTIETHERALDLAERDGWHIYDALIVAAAQMAEADILYTEDLQSGRRVDSKLRIINPF